MARGDGYSVIKRKRNGRELGHWQVRVQVPVDLRPIVKKSEVLRSTGTGDRRAANLLAPQVVADLYHEWQRVAGAPGQALTLTRRVPTEAELEEAAVVLGYEMPKESAEAGRKTLRGKHMYRGHVNWTSAELEEQVIAVATGDFEPVRDLADLAVEALGFDLAPGSEDYAKLCELLNRARLAGLQEQHQRNLGNVEADTDSKLVQRVRDREAARAKPGEAILDLFELWAAELLAKGEKRPDTVNQDRKVIEQFSAFVGRNRDVRSITPLEVAEYRDTLRQLPPKWMSKRELRDLDMRTAAVKARALKFDLTAYTTINKHLSTISPLYKWIAKHPRWAGMRNPVDGLFFDKVRGKNPRPPFSTDALNKILSSPLFTGFQEDGSEHVPGSTRADDWRYWIPLVCLFTGARIGEIAQLRLRDVTEQRGVWFIHIRHDKDEGLTTKSGETRAAAVHVMLEQLGFLAFHARQVEGAGGDLEAPMFPEIKRNARGQISGKPSRWWRDYLAAIGVKDTEKVGGDGQGAHSFRHTLTDRLRSEAELLDPQIAVVLGHSVKSTTSGYGSLSQGTVSMLKGYMDAVRFDGVKFDHLIAAEEQRALASSPLTASVDGLATA